MITRTFHPIGQGAFYSEQIVDKTIVYDCGIWYQEPNKKKAQQVVKNAFPDDAVIDALFISHFDYDHVSLVPLLLETFDVKAIVIPLLEPDEKDLIANLFVTSGLELIAELLRNPNDFARTNKIYILEVEIGESPNPNNENLVVVRQQFSIENPTLGNVERISSGTAISVSTISGTEWVYVPFNYKASSRSFELVEAFESFNIDITKIGDYEYFNENKGIIGLAYKSIEGNINLNSMFLYSGPSSNANLIYSFDFFYPNNNIWKFGNIASGCIYTGDGNLNIVDIERVYNDLWSYVGTIQLPHHGSKRDFKQNALQKGGYICPVSFGNNNPYGHPSGEVLRSLLKDINYPVLVCENASSIFIQHWNCVFVAKDQPSCTKLANSNKRRI